MPKIAKVVSTGVQIFDTKTRQSLRTISMGGKKVKQAICEGDELIVTFDNDKVTTFDANSGLITGNY